MGEDAIHLGLSGFKLGDQTVSLGKGIELRPTYGHVFSTDVLALAPPRIPGTFHAGRWSATSRNPGRDITASLVVPADLGVHRLDATGVGMTIVTLLRLWVDPEVVLEVRTTAPLAEFKDHPPSDDPKMVAMLFSTRERHVHFVLSNRDNYLDRLDWVREHWEAACGLRCTAPEFDFAITTFDSSQSLPNTAMCLVSIWGAIEAIFSPHKAELAFRASSQLAAYLEPRGATRLAKQRQIAKLYQVRSAAAHGAPKHNSDELLQTYELLRMAIIRMIERREVPTRERLEELLFGG